MDGKSSVTILVLALASAGLTGCIEAASLLNSSDVEVSAFENKRLADDAAQAWNADAALVAVMAFELTHSDDANVAADPDVGNGLAPAWWYVYCSESAGEVRAFKVAADGTVTSEEDAAEVAAGYEDHDIAQALDGWQVDSDHALEAAKTDERFRTAAEGYNGTLVQGVAHYEGQTAWWFAAISADGAAVARVDAATAELLEVFPLDMGMTMPAHEWGAQSPSTWMAEPIVVEGEGVAQPGDAPLEIPFETTTSAHGMLVIQSSHRLPTDGLHWAIYDENGDVVTEDHVGSWTRGSSYEAEIELEDAGEYTLALWYMSWMSPFDPPLGSEVEYVFHMELMPGHAEDDKEH